MMVLGIEVQWDTAAPQDHMERTVFCPQELPLTFGDVSDQFGGVCLPH
jgi:hypothetical protein